MEMLDAVELLLFPPPRSMASCPPSPGGFGEKQALVPQGVRAPFCVFTHARRYLA